MRRLFVIIIYLLFSHLAIQNGYGLTIVTPSEGQVVYQGDKLMVIVKPDAGEKWEKVQLDIYPMSYSMLTNDYREEIVIPKTDTGYIDFSILAYDKTGREIELKRKLFVKLPPNVVLQSIEVDQYKTLYKLPDGSPPQDLRRIESRQLRVYGKYSDGIERKLTSSALGTTYTSTNEKVVTVDKEGKIFAQGIGKAKITVRNDKFSATVDVVVKPSKP